MPTQAKLKARLYARYPWSSVALYNGVTVLHFLLGSAGIVIGYSFWPRVAYVAGPLYLALALAEMYILMPLAVCPNCVYYKLPGGLCISGLNRVSRRIARAGDPKYFGRRAEGLCSPNNLYLASLVVPLVAMLPALAVNFSPILLALFLAVAALLAFRFLVIFSRVACLHCYAKHVCPQAGAMGVRDR